MCGIAGLFRLSGGEAADLDSVRAMIARLHHRGPDDEGFCRVGGATFGHRRLAILDLSKNGRQPMSDESKRVWLAYNGEIYNFRELRSELKGQGHRFFSDTDTEVVLRGYLAWGMPRLLGALRGMFAFAIYDHRERAGYLVRDRFGIKPLYYSVDGDGLSFASEIPSLLEGIERVPSLSDVGLERFLSLGTVPAPGTVYDGVSALPAGHIITIGDSGIRVSRYAERAGSGEVSASSVASPIASASEIRDHLVSAVRAQLVSDVPLGVFLSGGTDSSALVSLASQEVERSGKTLDTLSISFAEQDHSEAPYARLMAERYRTNHREIEIGQQEFWDELPNVLQTMGQPTIDGVNTYFVSRAAREAGLTVVLSGLGGDEVFLGYPHFRTFKRYRSLLRMWDQLPIALRRAVVRLSQTFCGALPIRSTSKLSFLNRKGASGFYGLARGIFTPNEVRRLLGRESEAPFLDTDLYGMDEPYPDPLSTLVRLEFEHYLQNQLLIDTDQMSMAHSVEVRVPFLDEQLVSALAATPHAAKFDSHVNKPLLVESLGADLPREIWARRKQGFTFPMAHWLKKEDGSLSRAACDSGLFDPKEVKRVWAGFRAGRIHWSRPWALYVAATFVNRKRSRSSANPIARAGKPNRAQVEVFGP